MMRISRRHLASAMRIAVILSAFAAIVTATSGLLLVIHLNSIEHPADHDSEHCSFCRHSLIPSKKFLPGPFVHDACASHADPTALTPYASNYHPRTSQPRVPPTGDLAVNDRVDIADLSKFSHYWFIPREFPAQWLSHTGRHEPRWQRGPVRFRAPGGELARNS